MACRACRARRVSDRYGTRWYRPFRDTHPHWSVSAYPYSPVCGTRHTWARRSPVFRPSPVADKDPSSDVSQTRNPAQPAQRPATPYRGRWRVKQSISCQESPRLYYDPSGGPCCIPVPLSFSNTRLFTRPADMPRHAASEARHCRVVGS